MESVRRDNAKETFFLIQISKQDKLFMLGFSGFESLEFCANLIPSDNKEQNRLDLAFPGESVFCKALSLKDVLR